MLHKVLLISANLIDKNVNNLELNISNSCEIAVCRTSRISSAREVMTYVEDQQTGMSMSSWQTCVTSLHI